MTSSLARNKALFPVISKLNKALFPVISKTQQSALPGDIRLKATGSVAEISGRETKRFLETELSTFLTPLF